MKFPYLLPALVVLPLALRANHETITDASGTVAPLAVNLTLSESVGGYDIADTRKATDAAKGIDYPDFTVFSDVFTPDAKESAIRNPFGWEETARNRYVERVTTDSRVPESPVVTAVGALAIAKSRYTNATLLADLAAAGKIDSPAGYRIVAVTFDLEHEVHYTTPNWTTHVNDHLYFFAERGEDDPAPVFLGAEYKDVYIYDEVIAFTRSTTIRSGRYTDTFTGRADGSGYDYALKSQALTGTIAAEFGFFRPAPGNNLYIIKPSGLFGWSERYDARREILVPGPIASTNLTGPAQGYFHTPTEEGDHHAHNYIPNLGNQAVVTGSVKVASATRHDSMLKYLNSLPNVMPH